MRHTLVIAAREVRERTFVLLAAAFIAVIPFAGALFPGARRSGPEAFIGMLGSILAVGFTLGLAVILGASIVGRELTERRLSFYFARPVSAAAIWFGKLIGAIVLTAVSFAVIFVPTFLVAWRVWAATWNIEEGALVGIALVGSAFLVLLAHATSTIIRSRSGVAAVDLIAVAVIAGALWLILRPLFEAMALGVVKMVVIWLAAALILSLVGAGAWQLSRGRADLRRSHIELSKFLWITLGTAVAIAGAYTAWVFSAGPGDLTKPQAVQTGRGDWAFISGPARLRGDYTGAFLVNVASGVTIPFPQARWHSAEFTRRGDAAVARHVVPRVGGLESQGVVVQRFGRDERPLATGIDVGNRVVLSDDLSRLAVIGRETVSIHDIDGERLLASVSMPLRAHRLFAFFISPELLRLVATERADRTDQSSMALRIFELDIRQRTIAETGSWVTTGHNLQVRANADGSALLVTRVGATEGDPVVLLDGRTARVRLALPVDSAGYWSGSFLADGRIVVLSKGPERSLRLFSPDGTLIRDIPLGLAKRGRIVAENSNGHVVVSLNPGEWSQWPADQLPWDVVVVDVENGTVVRRESGVRPAFFWFTTDPRVPVPNATGDFVVDEIDGSLRVWNAGTGEKKKFL